MLTRRCFLWSLSATAFLGAKEDATLRVGCQTNAFRDPKTLDGLRRILTIIKDAGYEGFETNIRNVSLAAEADVVGLIEEIGLRFIGPHMGLGQGEQTLRAAVRRAAKLGARYVIVSGGGLARAGRLAQSALLAKAKRLNQLGATCHEHGLKLLYHNHWAEFLLDGAEINGLIRQTDPSLVGFLVDVGHVHRAGQDPAAFVAEHADRISALHVRNIDRQNKPVTLGTGQPDLKPLAAALRQSNWHGWLINEPELRSPETDKVRAIITSERGYIRETFGA